MIEHKALIPDPLNRQLMAGRELCNKAQSIKTESSKRTVYDRMGIL